MNELPLTLPMLFGIVNLLVVVGSIAYVVGSIRVTVRINTEAYLRLTDAMEKIEAILVRHGERIAALEARDRR